MNRYRKLVAWSLASSMALFGGACERVHEVDAIKGSTTQLRWCAEHPAPEGVDDRDYTCLDFDGATLPSTQELKSGGKLAAEHGWIHATVPEGTSSAWLVWSSEGEDKATTIATSVKMRADVPQEVALPESLVDFLCVTAGDAEGCLSYSHGRDTAFENNYTGYYFWQIATTPGGVYRTECEVPDGFSGLNATQFDLQIVPTEHTVEIEVGDETVTCASVFAEATNATISLGLRDIEGPAWSAAFDNFVGLIERDCE